MDGRKFTARSNKIKLDIKEPLLGFEPWLPASKIIISESPIKNQKFRVGEAISRKFIINVKGISVNQIPKLSANLGLEGQIKIYENKPIINEKVINNQPAGSRIEEYTIIPQQSGLIEFPEIKIKWWDVNNQKTQFATITSKTIQVEPKQILQNKTITTYQEIENKKNLANNTINKFYLYLILLLLVLNIIFIIIFVKRIKNKIKEEKKWIKGKISEIKKLNNIEEIEIFIIRHVAKKNGKKLSLKESLEILSKNDQKYFKYLNQEIEKHKYGKSKINIKKELLLLENNLLKIPKNKIEKKIIKDEIDIEINPIK